MPKVVLIGAGSHAFARRLIGDLMTWPSLAESTVCLMDLHQGRLVVMAALARQLVTKAGVGVKIEATTDLDTALEGANYVFATIRVGDSHNNRSIPEKYGIYQQVGDTMGPGGAFYFLYNAPSIIHIAQTMEKICPTALLLNYTNPMVMLCWTLRKLTRIKYVGLCHSVPNTAATLARYIGADIKDVSYWVAGINHMAWFLEYKVKGVDAYPQIRAGLDKPEIYEQDIVKFEVLKYFDAFVTESSIHMSEYTPYFLRTPELIGQHIGPKMWGVGNRLGLSQEERRARMAEGRRKADEEVLRLSTGEEPLPPIERSGEYATRIVNAMETNIPFVFNGNVPNTGLITNLWNDAIVEVPIMVDNTGLHPCYVGDLPPALAALNRSNLAVQELVVKGFVEKDRESIYRAIELDPLTTTQLSLAQIRQMVDEMFAADAQYIGF
jgi:alpha-galactosidase